MIVSKIKKAYFRLCFIRYKGKSHSELMRLENFIARRLAGSGAKSFSVLIIRIATVAIALSMTVMIVATSLITGFKNEISSKIFGFWGHIHITDNNINRTFEAYPVDVKQSFYPHLDTMDQVPYYDYRTFMGWQLGEDMVEKKTEGGIQHIQVFAHKPGIIKTKDQIEGIILKGVGNDFDWDNLAEYLKEGKAIRTQDSTASRDILISQQTSNRLKLKIGDAMTVHFVQDGDQIPRRFKVCGIYKTGLEEYDQKFALVDIRVIQEVLGWDENQVGGFEVFIDDISDLNEINEYIYLEELPMELDALTIRQKFPSIFEWLSLQDINEIVILVLMLLVAIINMMTTLMILILERTNMIGVLKALGNTDWGIRKIFLYQAAYIIGVGLFWGNLIGLSLCFIQKTFGIVKLSEADYYLNVAPIEINLWTILLLNLGTLVLTVLFLIIPSYLITSITPVKAIRFK